MFIFWIFGSFFRGTHSIARKIYYASLLTKQKTIFQKYILFCIGSAIVLHGLHHYKYLATTLSTQYKIIYFCIYMLDEHSKSYTIKSSRNIARIFFETFPFYFSVYFTYSCIYYVDIFGFWSECLNNIFFFHIIYKTKCIMALYKQFLSNFIIFCLYTVSLYIVHL